MSMRLKKILGCLLSLGMLLSPITICAEEDAGIVAYSMDPNDNRAFTSIIDAWDAACDGTLIYLNKDWELSSRLILYSGNNATLDLNGHSITRMLDDYESDGEVIYMNENSNLTLKGSTDRTFTVKNCKGLWNKGDKTADVSVGGVITGGMSSNGAGGIHMKANCTLNLDHVGVIGNETAAELMPHGGGIKLDGDCCTVNINNGSMVSYNSAGYGGGIYIAGEEGHVNVEASEISHNYASSDGGGIYSNYDATYIELKKDAMIKENKAGYNGGGVCFNNSYNHISSEDSTGKISSNFVAGYGNYAKGGGVYYADVKTKTNTATLASITFENNSAYKSVDYALGGAVYCNLGNVEITNCTFRNNTALSGGAIFINDSGTILKDCTITNNDANKGGGIYVDSRYDLKFSGKCVVKKNVNSNKEASNVYLENGTFTRAYVSGTPSTGSEVGLTGDGSCKVGINQSENNGTFFVDQSSSYHLSYDDGKLYQKNGATGSIFGCGNIVVVIGVIVCIACNGFIVYRNKRKKMI